MEVTIKKQIVEQEEPSGNLYKIFAEGEKDLFTYEKYDTFPVTVSGEVTISPSGKRIFSQAQIDPKQEKKESIFVPENPSEKQVVKRQETHPADIEIIENFQYGQAMMLLHKAEIDTAISTAKAFPRSLTKFMETARSYASYDPETAAGCSYALPRGGKLIEGASVRLAEIVCSTYGNIRAEGRVMEITDTEIVARGVCMDLETNNTQSTEVRLKITDKNGKRFNADMITMTGNRAAAVARRNAIFMVVPKVFVEIIRKEAKNVASGDIKTLPQRRDTAVNYFKSLKVTEAQICDVLEVQKIGDITLEHYAILSSMAQQIQNKENTVEELFFNTSDKDISSSRAESNEKLKAI